MAIEDSALYDDVIKLVKSKEYATRKIFECTLISGEIQCNALSVHSFTIDRNYKDCYSDSSVIEVDLPLGVYTAKIYPNRRNLFALLKIQTADTTGTVISDNSSFKYQQFRATIVDSKDPSLIDFGSEAEDEQSGDTGSIVTLSIQLTDELLETIRQTNFQAIIKNTDLASVVKGLLIGDIFKSNKLLKPKGVLMTEPDNNKLYKNIIIKPSLSCIDIVDWLQDNYGIYNNGLGVYLQQNYWYVFPILQTEKFKANNNSITVISMPANVMRGSEKTFAFKDNHLMIIATAGINQIDNSDSWQRNYGNGLRYINASKVIDDFSSTENGKTKISQKNNVVEFSSIQREDGNNYIPFSSDISKANNPQAISAIADSNDNKIVLTWENSLSTLLLPGMQVRCLYRFNDKVKKITGTLIGVRNYFSSAEAGILQNVQSSISLLTILVQSNI